MQQQFVLLFVPQEVSWQQLQLPVVLPQEVLHAGQSPGYPQPGHLALCTARRHPQPLFLEFVQAIIKNSFRLESTASYAAADHFAKGVFLRKSKQR